jgi:hypothetical protein
MSDNGESSIGTFIITKSYFVEKIQNQFSIVDGMILIQYSDVLLNRYIKWDNDS